MEVSVFPEAYINNSSDISISNTNKAILCSEILDKYKDLLCENKDGCIFKIDYVHHLIGECFSCYVSCVEFTAPKNTIFISNTNFDKLCLDLANNKVEITLINPPQASKIVFEVEDTVIDRVKDIKSTLESLLDQNYKFLEQGQKIPFLGNYLIVDKLEPYNVCLVNNTDLNVEFNIKNTQKELNEVNTETIVNEIEPKVKKLSRSEIRMKRLQYYEKLKNKN